MSKRLQTLSYSLNNQGFNVLSSLQILILTLCALRKSLKIFAQVSNIRYLYMECIGVFVTDQKDNN